MSRRAPHLVVVITPHGFGHAALTAPVVNALRPRIPGLRVTLRTTVDRDLLAARFDPPWDLVPTAADFGMRMTSALDTDVENSARAYASLHEHWPERVAEETTALTALAPDAILSNIPYLTLAAAARAGIPAFALCSLNWADIYRHYLGTRPEAAAVHAQILAAYASARVFIQPRPSMPMIDLPARRAVGPIARTGADRRDELRRALGLSARQRVVMIAPGGLSFPLLIERWPRTPDIRWLVSGRDHVDHPDALALSSIAWPFVDVLRGCDALIGKPGYGTFAEAACNGTPMLYVQRKDWPEEPYLIDWLTANGRALELDRAALERGDLGAALAALWRLPKKSPVLPTGIEEAADIVAEFL
ncbi:MAG: hypothetical protein ACOYXR_08490 [Nitrospirota bacterium]